MWHLEPPNGVNKHNANNEQNFIQYRGLNRQVNEYFFKQEKYHLFYIYMVYVNKDVLNIFSPWRTNYWGFANIYQK